MTSQERRIRHLETALRLAIEALNFTPNFMTEIDGGDNRLLTSYQLLTRLEGFLKGNSDVPGK